jgi:DTW domain-containing protein
VNLQTYLENKKQQAQIQPRLRQRCLTCWQPDFSCYCAQVQTFDCNVTFVILIHPMEARRRIATGRMSHLCLKNSYLLAGQDYSQNKTVNDLIDDPRNHCVTLYPGLRSVNLTQLEEEERTSLFPKDKKLVVFVIDGTWGTARKMMRLSTNVQNLPRICFTPDRLSNFRVRKQPKPECYSTVEAIHHTIELLGTSRGFNPETREHNKLLHVFDWMVESQLRFVERALEPVYRRVQKKL